MSWPASVGLVRFDPNALSSESLVACGARRAWVNSERGSIRHASSGARAGTVSAPPAQEEGWTRAMTCRAQPNQRLKLPAPVVNESGERSACGVVEFHL